MTTDELDKLSKEVGSTLTRNGLVITTAESCTGGGVSQALTTVAGSGSYFAYGFVTYSNLAKQKMLAVPAALLEGEKCPGAVSEETAIAMARGAISVSGADLAVSTSGIAGPEGAMPGKPVGTVWIGWAQRDHDSPAIHAFAERYQFNGDRGEVRTQTIAAALAGILKMVNN